MNYLVLSKVKFGTPKIIKRVKEQHAAGGKVLFTHCDEPESELAEAGDLLFEDSPWGYQDFFFRIFDDVQNGDVPTSITILGDEEKKAEDAYVVEMASPTTMISLD